MFRQKKKTESSGLLRDGERFPLLKISILEWMLEKSYMYEKGEVTGRANRKGAFEKRGHFGGPFEIHPKICKRGGKHSLTWI